MKFNVSFRETKTLHYVMEAGSEQEVADILKKVRACALDMTDIGKFNFDVLEHRSYFRIQYDGISRTLAEDP